jgi:hypothetical protein
MQKPAVRARFEDNYTEHMIKHNMPVRIRLIEDVAREQRWTVIEEAEWETLDEFRLQGVDKHLTNVASCVWVILIGAKQQLS